MSRRLLWDRGRGEEARLEAGSRGRGSWDTYFLIHTYAMEAEEFQFGHFGLVWMLYEDRTVCALDQDQIVLLFCSVHSADWKIR